MRFVAGHFPDSRQGGRILEVGCGLGANTGMLLQEGFDVYGIDLSPTAIELCRKNTARYGDAYLSPRDMLHTNFDDNFFDAACDVYFACCLTHANFINFLHEVHRVLKKDGTFFFYTPDTTSSAFIYYEPSTKIDYYTLDGIKRPNSPFFGNNFPFHFLDADKTDEIFKDAGFILLSLE